MIALSVATASGSIPGQPLAIALPPGSEDGVTPAAAFVPRLAHHRRITVATGSLSVHVSVRGASEIYFYIATPGSLIHPRN